LSATDIFLSYARTDRPAARLFAEALAAEAFEVWWDASLHSGETFDEVIERKLRDAKAVVVLWSPRSVASRWVRAEATLADRRNKLVPAIIEACDRPIAFELTHTSELAGWEGDRSDPRWRSFVEDLKRLTHADLEDQPEQTPAPVPAEAHRTHQPAARQPLRSESIVSLPAEELAGPTEVHCLEVEDGELADESTVVQGAGVKIGRAPPADFVVAHRSVSREHCIVGLANDELLVTDLNSTNGTYIDDVRIHRATILPVGSVLRVGQVSLRHTIMTKPEAGARERSGFQPARAAASS
jgi:pSer/pThr/pTyr-binding forkhead associated (FHA) protein